VRKYFAVLESRANYHGNELPIIFSYEGPIDAGFLEFELQSSAADTQAFGRACAVTIVLLQLAHDHRLFDTLE